MQRDPALLALSDWNQHRTSLPTANYGGLHLRQRNRRHQRHEDGPFPLQPGRGLRHDLGMGRREQRKRHPGEVAGGASTFASGPTSTKHAADPDTALQTLFLLNLTAPTANRATRLDPPASAMEGIVRQATAT